MGLNLIQNPENLERQMIIANTVLAKTETFLPVIGVVPATLQLGTALATAVTGIAVKMLSNHPKKDEVAWNLGACALVSGTYSLINIVTLGCAAPIIEYKTGILSSEDGRITSTPGFFGAIEEIRKGHPLRFI